MILFGLKGVGKTYFGERFAAFCGRPFVDTDHLMGDYKRFFREAGEKAFRLREEEIIASLQPGPIIAVGGGAMLSPRNRRTDLGPLVYLTRGTEIDSSRTAIYDTIKAHRVELDNKSDQEVIDILWAILSEDTFV